MLSMLCRADLKKTHLQHIQHGIQLQGMILRLGDILAAGGGGTGS